MKSIWDKKILFFFLFVLLFSIHPIFLNGQYEKNIPFTKESKSSEDLIEDDIFKKKGKSSLVFTHPIIDYTKSYTAFVSNLPINYYSFQLFPNLNHISRPPPINF